MCFPIAASEISLDEILDEFEGIFYGRYVSPFIVDNIGLSNTLGHLVYLFFQCMPFCLKVDLHSL